MEPVDVEAALVQLLDTALDVPVSTLVPATRPESFVRVRSMGGPRINLAQAQPLILVEAWAADEPAAQALAAQAWQAIDAAEGTTTAGMWLAETNLNVPFSNYDLDGKQPRYQFTAAPVVNLAA